MAATLSEQEVERARAIMAAQVAVFKIMWSQIFPAGHCTVASLILAPVLRSSLPFEFEVVVGTHGKGPHVWVEGGGYFYDSTLGQFEDKPAWIIARVDDLYLYDLRSTRRLVREKEDHFRDTIEPNCFSDDLGTSYSAHSAMKDLWRGQSTWPL